jgi:hypothetical protein
VRGCVCTKIQKPPATARIGYRICSPDRSGRRRRRETPTTLIETFAWSTRMRRDIRDDEDARRPAHNPEVAGSNFAPATKARGSLSNLLAAQPTVTATIIWAVFSIAVSSAMSAHRSHDTWQRPPVPSLSRVTGSRNRWQDLPPMPYRAHAAGRSG